MNFFTKKKKLLQSVELDTDPIKLYNSLTKEKEYLYLWGIQEEVLNQWEEKRNEESLLIKMNTGAGKTLVGLLILYSKMLELKAPAIFMCPDKQLVQQVIEQSGKYNIPTCEVDEENDFTESFLNNKAILVTTVNKMFNGKNIFDREKIKPSAVVFDDAHRCVEKVKDVFTIKIYKNHDLYELLLSIFEPALREQSIASFEAIDLNMPYYYMKVPFWSWIDNVDKITKLLTKYVTDEELFFKWDLISNNLEQYEVYVDSKRIEITPMKSFVKNISAFDLAEHKYALSATFLNDTSLLKDLDFSIDSIQNPITPKDRKDYGQRLVIAPKRALPSFSDENLLDIVSHHLRGNHNVVVLVPDYRYGKKWEEKGATIITKETIDEAIINLKKTKGNFVVFVNRYEGIDLSGDSCNILILHDFPKFKFIKDEYYNNIHHQTSSNIIAQTIEQGVGRSVRSGNDYSVVYLVGRHILKFLRERKKLDFFNQTTKRQFELGLDLIQDGDITEDNVVSNITSIAEYCLNQDQEWKSYYNQFMSSKNELPNENQQNQLQKTQNETKAIDFFIHGKFNEAANEVLKNLNLSLTEEEKACSYEMAAHFIYLKDKNGSNNYLVKSKSISNKMLTPFLSKERFKLQKNNTQIKNSIEFINSFSTTNDLIIFINEIDKNLIYDPDNKANDFEEALKDLGSLLGFRSSRPERELGNGGCDVLWGIGEYYLIMEAKSEKEEKNKISKSDVEQIYHSIEWFNNNYIYNGGVLGITLQPNRRKNEDVAINDSLRSIDTKKLKEIKISLSKLKAFLTKHANLSDITIENLKLEFNSLELNENQFLNKYVNRIK